MVFLYVFLTILISTRIAGFASFESLEKPAIRISDSGKGQEFQRDGGFFSDRRAAMEATCGSFGRTAAVGGLRDAEAGTGGRLRSRAAAATADDAACFAADLSGQSRHRHPVRALRPLPFRHQDLRRRLYVVEHRPRAICARPLVGSVLVLSKTKRLRRGHVGVVTAIASEREIRLDHANWQPDAIITNMAVMDVSPANDWTQLRFWNKDARMWGAVYPASGFVYNLADKGKPTGTVTTVISSGNATHGTPQQPLP